MIRNKFTRLEVLKNHYPSLKPLYTQSWVYTGIASYFSSIEKFDFLEFVDDIIFQPIEDYRHDQTILEDNHYYGNVFEGDIDYWFTKNTDKIVKVIAGRSTNEKRKNVHVLGFDYWDILTYKEFQNPVFFNEINRTSLKNAVYDVVIATGRLRGHRERFLQILRDIDSNLSVVTDDNQTVYPTDLRFGNLGFEVYLNKLGAKKFHNYTPYPSFFDTNESRTLDHMPHKKIYQTSLVNAVLETTVYNTPDPFLTEKTYKALAHSRPFVIVGDTNSLAKLKKQGFMTFSDFCDESYDTITDLEERIQMCVQSLLQLVESCKTNPEKINEICQHNHNLFFSRKRHFNNLANFGKLCIDNLYV